MSSKTQMTGSDSPLGQAQDQHGVTSTPDLQRKQAEARSLQATGGATSHTSQPMSPEDIADMKKMSVEYGQELAALNGQLAEVQAKIADTTALIIDINNQIERAEYKPLHVVNKEYLEQQKRDLEARFSQTNRIKEALASVGVEGNFDYSKLGNGPSPLDQAIAAKNASKRQVVQVVNGRK
jgi:hypothetical protein